jgi:hypothetical protein
VECKMRLEDGYCLVYIKLLSERVQLRMGKRSRVVCLLKCFISMSKSIVFLFLFSLIPTVPRHQGFVVKKQTLGFVPLRMNYNVLQYP